MRRVDFHELAEQELNEAAAYYASIRLSLGDAFVRQVELAVQRISESPAAGAPKAELVRWWPVSRFPYAVVYRVGDESIRVLAVAHHRRRPAHWRGRD